MLKTILIIDDEQSVVGVMRLVLQIKGYRVLLAFSFVEAVTLWNREKDNVEMLIVDLGVVVPEGSLFFEVFEKLDLEILYMSGSPQEAESYTFGQSFILKPFRSVDLVRRLSPSDKRD